MREGVFALWFGRSQFVITNPLPLVLRWSVHHSRGVWQLGNTHSEQGSVSLQDTPLSLLRLALMALWAGSQAFMLGLWGITASPKCFSHVLHSFNSSPDLWERCLGFIFHTSCTRTGVFKGLWLLSRPSSFTKGVCGIRLGFLPQPLQWKELIADSYTYIFRNSVPSTRTLLGCICFFFAPGQDSWFLRLYGRQNEIVYDDSHEHLILNAQQYQENYSSPK